ncbi:hypothetical protein ACEPPN_001379 [Leptodophora sp. 'Broadleaf-Isolate-01']
MSVLCLLSSVVILKSSNGQPIDSWPSSRFPIQPSVLLSICTVIANFSTRTMFDSGITISWWRKAYRGSTVGELHRSWSYGTGLLSIVTEGRHFNTIALASILVTLVLINGPLLQRASTVTTKGFLDISMVTVNFSPNMSMVDHPTGRSTGRASGIDILSNSFLPVVQSYSAREPILLGYTGCNGTCTTEIIGPGFDVECAESASDLIINQTAGAETDVLNFSFGFDGRLTDAGLINLSTTLHKSEAPTKPCTRNCMLRLSQVRYQVRLKNGTVELLAPAPETNNTINIEQIPLEPTGLDGFSSTVGGIYLSASKKWGGTATLYKNGSPYQLITSGETLLTYLTDERGDFTWVDPTDIFITGMRELLFRTAISASSSNSTSSTADASPAQQIVQASQVMSRTVYSSRYSYLIAAFSLMLAAIASTSMILYGWWQLPRAFTLGPIEVAKAFNAPFLEDSHFYGTGEKAFKGMEKKGIRYGEILDVDGGSGMRGNDNMDLGTEFGSDIELLGQRGSGQRGKVIGMGAPDSVRGLLRSRYIT